MMRASSRTRLPSPSWVPGPGRAARLRGAASAVIGVTIVSVLVACSSNTSSTVVRSSTTGASASSPHPSVAAPSGRSGQHKPTVAVVPATGLRARQQVQVRAAGFTPAEALQVVECAAKGTATGPADCNLSDMLAATSDSDGRVDARLTVLRGPFGADRVVCSARTPCLVSVTQASLNPTEEADAAIAFRP
jgi:hypothetical protein